MTSIFADLSTPQASLFRAFAAWKSLLLAIAVGSGVGQPYDTSTTLHNTRDLPPNSEAPWDIGSKLTRWDALYFVQTACKGYVHEQDRAFGPGSSWLMARIVQSRCFYHV